MPQQVFQIKGQISAERFDLNWYCPYTKQNILREIIVDLPIFVLLFVYKHRLISGT